MVASGPPRASFQSDPYFCFEQQRLFPMPESSQQDRKIIAEYPLGGSLDFLRDKLHATKQPLSDSNSYSYQKAVSLLLAVLMGYKAAYYLESKGSSADLAFKLFKAFTRIRTSLFNYKYFQFLVLLVTN